VNHEAEGMLEGLLVTHKALPTMCPKTKNDKSLIRTAGFLNSGWNPGPFKHKFSAYFVAFGLFGFPMSSTDEILQ
jgi:hypothetical protein